MTTWCSCSVFSSRYVGISVPWRLVIASQRRWQRRSRRRASVRVHERLEPRWPSGGRRAAQARATSRPRAACTAPSCRNVSASPSDASCGSPSWRSMSSSGGTRRLEPAEVVPFAVGVPQAERDGIQHLVAERDPVHPHRLAVTRLAHGDYRDERPEGIDDQLARRRCRPRGDDDHVDRASARWPSPRTGCRCCGTRCDRCGGTEPATAPRSACLRAGSPGAAPLTRVRRRCTAGRARVRSPPRPSELAKASSRAATEGSTKLRKNT